MSAVASADNNTNSILQKANDDNSLNINDLNYENLSKTGDGSFAELNTAINSGTSKSIDLTKDYTYSSSDVIKEGILINKNDLIIDGKGHTIDANSKSRIFYVNSTNVTLKNINFINGNSFDKSGGAIYGNGECLRVLDCTFINNKASWGGAIFSHPNSYSVFVRSTFKNNTAEYGGALVTYHGIRQDVLYCNFVSNHATDSGGALLIRGQLGTTENPYDDVVNVRGCLFTGNNAPEGSAISNDISAIINLTDSIILGSNPETLVYSWGRMFTANNNWWGNTIDNRLVKPRVTSQINVDSWLYLDLAISLDSSTATVSINNLYNSQTGKESIYSTNKLPSIGADLTGVNATLDSNKINLGNTGKALFNYTVLGDFTVIANCGNVVVSKKFKSGSFNELQSLIDSHDDEIVLQKDYFYTQSIDKSVTGISISKTLTIDGNGYIINAAGKSRVFNLMAKDITLKNIVISNGNARYDDGAGVKSQGMNAKFINCTFINNVADGSTGGSALYLAGKNTTIIDCKFINNAHNYILGGAIYSEGMGLNIENSLFENNYAKVRGGAIYIGRDGATITNCIFKNNTARDGGAIYDLKREDNPTRIYDSTFIANKATYDSNDIGGGGAIYGGDIEIVDTVFRENFAKNGAAILASNNVNIEKSSFINNTGEYNGIIYFLYNGSVYDSIFLNNNMKLGGYVISSLWGGVKANYNWYGNVWSNYKNTPSVSNLAEMNNWLFLNLTNIEYSGETFSGKFELMVYDSDNDVVELYDFSNLESFDLNLSSQNLTLNKKVVALDETFVAEIDYYKGNLIARYEDVVYNMPFKFQKDTWFELNSTIEVQVTKNQYINELLHPFEYSYMPFLISNQRITYEIGNSSIAKVSAASGKITGLKVGVTTLTIRFNGYDVMGRDMYKPCNITVKVNVTRIPVEIKESYEVPKVIYVGSKEQLILTTNPYAGLITYSSNDTSVAKVNSGIVSALKEGVVKITATYPGNEKYRPASASYVIKVSKRVSSIEIIPSGNITIDKGNDYYIGAISTPSDVELTYASSNPNVAIVEGTRIIGVGSGFAYITVSFAGNDKYLPSSSKLLVKVIDYATQFEVNSTIEVNVTDFTSIHAILKDIDGNRVSVPYGYITYQSNNTNIAEVDANGGITGVNQGKASILISFTGYQKYLPSQITTTVVVKVVPTKITVESEIELHVDNQAKINATLDHGNSYDLQYSSNDTSVVSVSRYGTLIAYKVGTAEITINYPGTKKYVKSSARAIVKVTRVPTKIDVGKTFSLLKDEKENINAHLNPNPTAVLTYLSSNKNVVIIDSEGMVTAVGLGKSIVTISFAGDEKYAPATEEVEVNVYKDSIPTSINVNKTITLYACDKIDIGAVLNPSNAGRLIYTSNDTSVVNIDEKGIITAVGKGKASISIHLERNNNKFEESSANVVVNVLLVSTKIDAEESITVNLTENAKLVYSFSHPEAGNLEFIIANPNIATFENGAIIGKSVGSTTVKINFNGNRQYASSSKTVKVNVVDVPVKILASDVISVNVTESAYVGAKLDPAVAGSLVYTSSNSNIVSVDRNTGKLTANKVGEADITANKVGEADITVSFAANGKYRANSIKVHIKVVNVKVDIEIENIYLSLRIDDVLNINATLNPDVGTLKYVSSNSNVVSVDGSGQIKALKVGNAKLTVSYEGKGKYASSSKDVIVSVSKIPTQIEINNNLTMEIGENFNIKPILKPSASGNLKYSSSNGNIVGVDNGFVTTIGSGKAKITISYAGNEKYLPCEATVDVTVTARPTSIKVNDSITIGFGESMELGAVLKTKYFDLDGTLLYESSNPSIVTVNGNGLINAIRKGSAIITIKYNGARTSSGILVNQPCNATVKIFVTTQTTKITVNSEKLSLNVDDSAKIIAALDRPKNGVLKYSSNNKSVATVDATGNVRAVGEGVAIITILYPGNEDYRSSSANVAVSVSRHPSNIKSNLSYYIKVDDNIDLGAVTYPNNGVLTYSSSNPDIVTVDAKGRVTGLKSGSAIISIKFAGDKKYLAKEKKVTVLVSRIATSINVKPIQMYVGEEFAIKDALTPAGIGKLTYDGYDWEMIDVDSKGTVTALMVGTTEILISYGGNYKYAPSNGTVSVTVKKLVVPPEDYKFDIVVRDEYNKATFSLTLPDYLEGTFSITVDGVDNYAEPIVNGIAKCIVDDLSAGQHSVTMRYSGDELYSSFAQNANFYVSEIKIDKNRDISILYTASGRYTVHLTKDTKAMSGKNVIFKLNGKKIIAKTNKNGYASIKVKLPYRAKAYIVSAQFGKVKVSNKISIKSIVVAKNVAIKKSSKYATIKVSLKKVNKKYLINKKLILKFNGKKIIAKTNKKGVATFKIKKNIYYKLKVGKKYNYQVTYLKNTVTKKVTIKR